MTNLWRPSKTALAVVLVIGMLVALYVHWDALCRWFEARRTCAQLASGTRAIHVFYFSGRSDSKYTPPLEPGVYRITITGDCYHSDCDLEIRPGGPGLDAMGYSTPTCRGEQFHLLANTWDVIGFMVPLERIHVRILRDQKLYYEGAPQKQCAEGAVCILPLAR